MNKRSVLVELAERAPASKKVGAGYYILHQDGVKSLRAHLKRQKDASRRCR